MTKALIVQPDGTATHLGSVVRDYLTQFLISLGVLLVLDRLPGWVSVALLSACVLALVGLTAREVCHAHFHSEGGA